MLRTVWDVADRIRYNLRERHLQNFIYACMYEDSWLQQDANLLSTLRDYSFLFGNNSINIIRNGIDSIASLVSKNHPKVRIITDGAEDNKARIRAENLTKYVYGVKEDIGFRTLTQKLFTDGGVQGTGAIKFYADYARGKVGAERVFINEILVDDSDARLGKPRQLHHRMITSRDQLAELYPEHEAKILACQPDQPRGGPVHRVVGETIPVLESWHLPTTPTSGDGYHVISIDNQILLAEPYEEDFFPFVFWRWADPCYGFWGRGIAQELEAVQADITFINQTIREAQKYFGTPIWWIPEGSQVSPDQILDADGVGKICKFFGPQPPTSVIPGAIAPEMYQWVNNLEQKGYQSIGMNQHMAQGEKQPGTDSAVAIRESADIAAGRFQNVGQRWESMHVDAAKIIINISKKMAKKIPGLRVTVMDKSAMSSITWEEVDMEADRFVMKCFPVSSFPTTPGGRLQSISELSKSGLVRPEWLMDLLDMPDLESYSDLELATQRIVRKTISTIKYEGIYPGEDAHMKPFPEMRLQQALQLARDEKVLAVYQECTDEVLDLIDAYIQDIELELRKQMPPPPPPGMPPMGGPPPGMPPQG